MCEHKTSPERVAFDLLDAHLKSLESTEKHEILKNKDTLLNLYSEFLRAVHSGRHGIE